jgi:hypothetical protein
MTTNEKDEMIKKILANHNAAMAATAASTPLEAEMIIEHEVSDEDFVQPSG